MLDTWRRSASGHGVGWARGLGSGRGRGRSDRRLAIDPKRDVAGADDLDRDSVEALDVGAAGGGNAAGDASSLGEVHDTADDAGAARVEYRHDGVLALDGDAFEEVQSEDAVVLGRVQDEGRRAGAIGVEG